MRSPGDWGTRLGRRQRGRGPRGRHRDPRRPLGGTPWRRSAELAEALVGKIVVTCVNPLGFDKHGAYRAAG